MTVDETIAAAVQAQVSPVLSELRRLTAEVEALRRALPTRMLSISEAAEHLGISVATVRRRVRDGSLPSKKLGRSVRIDATALGQVAPAAVDARVLDIRTTLAARREHASGET